MSTMMGNRHKIAPPAAAKTDHRFAIEPTTTWRASRKSRPKWRFGVGCKSQDACYRLIRNCDGHRITAQLTGRDEKSGEAEGDRTPDLRIANAE
jgi:hypothetical protein